MAKINSEQLQALRCFAERNGRTWKSKLSQCWMTGQYPDNCDVSALLQVRNQFGPSWLVRFKLPLCWQDAVHAFDAAVGRI